VWTILVVGAPFLRGEWKTLTAAVMLVGLALGAALTNFHQHLPGQGTLGTFLKFIEWIGLEQRELSRKQQIFMTLSGLTAYGAFYLALVWKKMNTAKVSKVAISL
jgi:hypothetical protein